MVIMKFLYVNNRLKNKKRHLDRPRKTLRCRIVHVRSFILLKKN